MLRAILIALAALSSVACATAIRLAPVTAGGVLDPHSPEPPVPPISQTLRPEAPEPQGDRAEDSAHAGHEEGQPMPIADAYTCPMHPEVKSDKPGTCPKCGMKLVPVKPTPEAGSPK